MAAPVAGARLRTAPPTLPSAHAHSQPANPINLLAHDSYTALRLSHATPEHLHLTTRACFIGPIPEGWLRSHRRDWYKSKVGLHYSSRAATFRAAEGTGRQRRVSGLGVGGGGGGVLPKRRRKQSGQGTDGKTRQLPSFPQPDDIRDDEPSGLDGSNQAVQRQSGAKVDDPKDDDHFEIDKPTQPQSQQTEQASVEPAEQASVEPAEQAHSASAKEDTTQTASSQASQAQNQSSEAPEREKSKDDGDDKQENDDGGDDGGDDTASIETVRPAKESVTQQPSMSALLRPQRPPNGRMHSNSSNVTRSSRARRASRTTSLTSSSFVTASEGGSSEDEAFEHTAPTPSENGIENDGASVLTAVREDSPDKSPHLSTNTTTPNGGQADLFDPRTLSLGATDVSAGLSQTSQGPTSSTASLIRHDATETGDGGAAGKRHLQKNDAHSSRADLDPGKAAATDPVKDDAEAAGTVTNADDSSAGHIRKHIGAAVHFQIPENAAQRERQVRARIAQLGQGRTMRRLRRARGRDGEIIKMANMLVKVQFTNHAMPPDFDENDSGKIEARIMDKWKEFMVVCRENDDDETPFSLQMYSSRVIPAQAKADRRKHCRHEIGLNRKTTRVNLFSSLDKTMVVWTPYRKGTLIYTMQAKSGAESMEWYTFLRNVQGWPRTSVLQINVPDLNVNIRLDDVFERLESARTMTQAAEGDDDAILQTLREEQAAAATIIQRCMDMLRKSPDWGGLLESWVGEERIGLAWKRYDRLEWVYGANEQKMYGTIAMDKSHELELRPKQHYPTTVRQKAGDELTEPPPVEGFLVRLTSQRGADQKLGKLFYKRLYFSTHGNYLVFNRPTKADPPAPPDSKLFEQYDQVPSAHQLAEEVPLIFAVNPYPLTPVKQVEWLSPDVRLRAEDRRACDAAAEAESKRRLNTILDCDGMVNLCHVSKVRSVRRGATPADDNIGSGGESDVDFDEPVRDSAADDGTTNSLDDNRTFELLLRNGLVVRLQAFDKTTRNEWMHRLRELVHYWTLRITADISLFKAVRAQNLAQLNVDEGVEAFIGQFGRKWEVSHSYASPELYHTCSLSQCRSITMSGSLFRKGRTNASFDKNLVVLAQGHLIMFQDSLRSRSGTVQKHIHHDRVTSLDLRDCYVYSGLATEDDLGSAGNTNFEGARPGHNALPRIYPGDGWSSTDEAVMTCFVVWHGRRKSWFRGDADKERADHHVGLGGAAGVSRGDDGHRRQQLKRVRTLGVTGKRVIFMARSRAERDHWVINIGMEIERLSGRDEVRVTGSGGDDSA